MSKPLRTRTECTLRSFAGLSGKLGLCGGSFDPVHLGHLHMGAQALAHGMDRVVFIPAAQNPLKPAPPASAEDRVEMLYLAIADEPRFFLSEIELERGGQSYTVDTLRQIRSEVAPAAKLFGIIGSDSFADLHRWREITEIARIAPPITIPRSSATRSEWSRLIDALPLDAAVRGAIKSNFAWDSAVIPASATDIRAGNLSHMPLPPRVAKYIRERGIYRRESV